MAQELKNTRRIAPISICILGSHSIQKLYPELQSIHYQNFRLRGRAVQPEVFIYNKFQSGEELLHYADNDIGRLRPTEFSAN